MTESALKVDKPSRLMISKMVLENFKSYAGVQDIGPFHKRFSSVVGPNGSGKSNVIDALLFVFGKKASQLRLSKVSELIHKSSGHPNLEYTRVSVHFQLIYDDEADDDSYEVVSGSEFIVTRLADKNNQSKYKINGINSTYNEVGSLLRSHGIDLVNNRFLILQGEVEQIAMMKPKGTTPHEDGLLEYLEDIIGSNRFVERIDEVSKSLESINEQRIERVNKLKLAERERDNLSGSKTEAETFLEKERSIRVKKNTLFQVFEHVAMNNVRDYESRIDKIQAKLQYERNKLAEHDQLLQRTEQEYHTANQEYTLVADELQHSTTEFAAFERRDVKLQEDMKYAMSELKKKQAARDKESKKETDCNRDNVNKAEQIESNKKQLSDLKEKKSDEDKKVEEVMASLQEQTKPLRDGLEQLQISKSTEESKIASQQSEKEVVNARIAMIRSRVQSASTQLNQLTLKQEKLRDSITATEEKITVLKGPNTGVDGLTQSIQTLQQEFDDLSQQESAYQGMIRDTLRDIEESKSKLQALTSPQTTGANNACLQAVMKMTQGSGVLSLHRKGIHGRLGDLGCIPAVFDVAVSTACGSYLDHIVVDNTEAAQACINYLRDANVGRASFIMLDQIGSARERMTAQFRVPNNSTRLFDIVTSTSPLYLPAFYMAMSNTLVTENLDEAVKIAYGDGGKVLYRVVTKTGDVIDKSGAMSGGGKEVKSGLMKLDSVSGVVSQRVESTNGETAASVTELIRRFESTLETQQHELKVCRERRATTESQLKNSRSQLKVIDSELEKTKLTLQSMQEQQADLQSRAIALSNETTLTSKEESEIQSLTHQLEDLDAVIQRTAPNLKSISLEVSSLQTQILNIGGPKLGKAQARIQLLSDQIDKLETTLSYLEVDYQNNLKTVTKAGQSIAKLSSEISALEDKLNKLKQEQVDMEQDALMVIQALEDAKEKMVSKEQALKSITKTFNELKHVLSGIKTVEVDLNVELERNMKEMQSNRDIASGWKHKLESLRREHIDEHKEFQSSIRQYVSMPGEDSNELDKNREEAELKEIELPVLSDELLLQGADDIDDMKKDISLLEAERERLRSGVNMSALLEYLKKDAQYKVRVSDLENITEERNRVRGEHESLRRQRLEEFMNGFGVITLKLKEMYQMITLGGDAELELVDSLDPFSEGIVFSVRPPKKSWKNISNLSGGEKTLSSLALVFALHHYKPTPLYVMDEIDAALDFKNVSIVANYIKDRTKNAQFVIISLRNNMFELADRLVGIYKTHDATKSVTINPKMFADLIPSSELNLNSSTTTGVTKLAAGEEIQVRKALADTTNTARIMG